MSTFPEPTEGGSYTRDPETGELTRNPPAEPATPDTEDQE